jgi:DNA-binding LytR/AlgR family response regulator
MEKDMLKVLILEDDLFFQTSLRYMLEGSDYTIIKSFDSLENLEDFFEENEVDIFICDLNINGEIVKKELLQKIKMKNIPIICITATLDEGIYDEIKDIVSSYLVKPFHKITLLSAIKKSVEQMRDEKLYNHINGKFIYVRKKGNILEKFNLSDIIYLESAGNYCYIHTTKKKLIEKISLNKMLKTKLDSRFRRVHHKFAINTEYLETFSYGELELMNHQVIPVSNTFKVNLNDIVGDKKIISGT